MSISITPFYAGLIALVYIALTVRVIRYRRANQLSVGDYGDKVLLQRIRAQANCMEYGPFGLLLMLLIELQGAPSIAIHALGLMLFLGRAMHAVGFSRQPQIMGLRVAGMALTLFMMVGAALGLIGHAVV